MYGHPPTPAVQAADSALSSAAQALEAYKPRSKSDQGEQSKICASQILSAASKVVNALDGIASMHPATQVLFGIFKAVIKMEGERENNQIEITAVMFTMVSIS
jgi:hypothetical protein